MSMLLQRNVMYLTHVKVSWCQDDFLVAKMRGKCFTPKFLLTLHTKIQSPVATSKFQSNEIKFCMGYFFTIMHQMRGWPVKKSRFQFFSESP